METKSIKGGQGRSSHDIASDGMVMLWIAAAAVALVGLAILREVAHG